MATLCLTQVQGSVVSWSFLDKVLHDGHCRWVLAYSDDFLAVRIYHRTMDDMSIQVIIIINVMNEHRAERQSRLELMNINREIHVVVNGSEGFDW